MVPASAQLLVRAPWCPCNGRKRKSKGCPQERSIGETTFVITDPLSWELH
jgi:hypothetical protein